MSTITLPPRQPGESISAARLREYERRKQAWLDESLNDLTCAPGTYDAAMRQIARDCGI